SLAYTEDSVWRNRAEFLHGRAEIQAFLRRKWSRELDYRLIKEIWACGENRIAVRFAYEWHDDSGHWFRSYGNENWEFDERGLMRRRIPAIHDLPILETERQSGSGCPRTSRARARARAAPRRPAGRGSAGTPGSARTGAPAGSGTARRSPRLLRPLPH